MTSRASLALATSSLNFQLIFQITQHRQKTPLHFNPGYISSFQEPYTEQNALKYAPSTAHNPRTQSIDAERSKNSGAIIDTQASKRKASQNQC